MSVCHISHFIGSYRLANNTDINLYSAFETTPEKQCVRCKLHMYKSEDT